MKLYVVPIYEYKLHISIGDDPKQIVSSINRKLKSAKLSQEDIANIKDGFGEPKALGFFLKLSLSGHSLIWLRSDIDTKNYLNIIATSHEVIHAAIEVFNHIGSVVNEETEEPFCYLHDEILKVCLKELEKRKDGNNNTTQKQKGVLPKLADVSKPHIAFEGTD